MRNASRFLLTCTLIFGVLLIFGCGGGGSPTVPDTTASQPDSALSTDTQPDSGSRVILGSYKVILNESGELTIRPHRQSEIHFNVTMFLLPPKCSNCLKGELISKDGNNWVFKFTLKNPTYVTGYDVRAIILETGNLEVTNEPDSYTEMYAAPEDPTPINPFYIFDSLQGQNAWSPMTQGSREFSFYKPDGSSFGEIDFLIDASWPHNQDGPVQIMNINASNPILMNDQSTFTNITCDIPDWQDDLENVRINLTAIGGNISTPMFQAPSGVWFANGLVCAKNCAAGEKTLWITAEDNGERVHNFVVVTVEEAPPPPPPTPAEWTFMLYLNQVNLPAEEDINEMEVAGSLEPDEYNLIVLWDKPEDQDVILRVVRDPAGYNDMIISPVISEGGAVIPPGGLDMGDGQTLENFLVWTFENYPAKHYAISLWDHGGGIFIQPKDDAIFKNLCSGLSLWEVRTACENALATQTLVDKLDIIGCDVCVLAWIETSYCWKDVADIVIASENSEPGFGWEYATPLSNLRENINTYTAEQLAYDFVEYYMISYTDPSNPYHYLSSDCTQSAASSNTLVDITVPALNAFCTIAIDYLPEYYDELDECRSATGYWGWDISDVGHFAWEVANHPGIPADLAQAALDLVNATEAAMINHGGNDGVPEHESGWKIWFPKKINEAPGNYLMEYLEPGYINFYETLWDEFLWKFAGEIPIYNGWLVIEDVELSDVNGGDGDGLIESGEEIEAFITIRNTGGELATNVDGEIYCQDFCGQYFHILNSGADYTDVPAGGIAVNSVPYTLSINSDCAAGVNTEFRVNLYCDQSSSLNHPVNFLINPSDVLVIDLDSNNTSAQAIKIAIEDNGYSADLIDSAISLIDMSPYQAVFITLGMWDDYNDMYIPSQEDYDVVENYLNSGGKVYLESGDLWAYYPGIGSPDFGPMFGIEGLDDGPDSISGLTGVAGTMLDGLNFEYTGDDGWIDEIGPVSGSEAILNAVDPAFTTMIANDKGNFKTVGFSMEFGGIADGTEPNTRIELMDRILEFFGL